MAANKKMLMMMAAMMMMMLMLISAVHAATATDCTSLLTELTPCLPFVADQTDTPSPECCTGLAAVTKANASCLCLVLTNPAVPNITRAEELPALCNVTIPNPSTLCPSAAPQTAPIAPTTSITPPTTPDENGGNYGMGPMPMGVSFAVSLEKSVLLPLLTIILASTILLQGQIYVLA